ncbi:MAG: hypothetical protein V3V08_16450 [Nannocystaceae bacterium]
MSKQVKLSEIEFRHVAGGYNLDALYCPYYCEENVWQMHAMLRDRCTESAACFVSSGQKRVAMWRQSAAAAMGIPVVWDYHVFFCCRIGAGAWQVLDFESLLPHPVDAATYLADTFPASSRTPAGSSPRFRLVPGAIYREKLRTDRSHMRQSDGAYRRPPPSWAAIGQDKGAGSNLDDFVDMDHDFVGEVYDLDALRGRLIG